MQERKVSDVDLNGFQFIYDKSNRISNDVSIVYVFSTYKGKDNIHLYVNVNSCHNIILTFESSKKF